MQNYFYELADFLSTKLEGTEVFTCMFNSEDSDFVRFNQSKVRQAGRIKQRYLVIDLIHGQRHAEGQTTLTCVKEEDQERLVWLLGELRKKLPSLPEDPHLLYATEVNSTEEFGKDQLPDPDHALAQILKAGEGRDLVGIYAAGGIFCGFANSLGQRNWYSSYSYNFDWSFYHRKDKAVKSSYAGFVWDDDAFTRKVTRATEQLLVLEQEPKTIEPGDYRVYLSPTALYDYLGILGWGGYGLKSHRTKQTVLIKMTEEGQKLHPSVTIKEYTKDGVAANFQSQGFIKPDQVTLIENGAFSSCLVSPRSAKEYNVPTNGANAWEAPDSLDVAPGEIPEADILERLGTGLFINNLWYLNYSDRPACRITGMTRFACFWVENGRIAAPLNVMRFDETLYRAFGENLIGFTREREMILDPETYGGRHTYSGRLPGALIRDFRFNL